MNPGGGPLVKGERGVGENERALIWGRTVCPIELFPRAQPPSGFARMSNRCRITQTCC